MFAIKIVSISGDYEMFSCNDFTVSIPTSGTSRPVDLDPPLDECPTIGIWIYEGEDKRFEGRPIQNVAYVINNNGKTIDTIRP